MARLQSIKDKQDVDRITAKQARVINNRNNFVRDYLNKTARLIVNYCTNNQIGKLIVGLNKEWKQSINLGAKTNQKFTQIPHTKLIEKLKHLCERYGIELIEQEESYTSRSSFLDNDPIPVYNPKLPQEHKFSGKRIKRGLYRTKNKILVNADLNGAANIIRKCNQGLELERLSSGLLIAQRGAAIEPLASKSHRTKPLKNLHLNLLFRWRASTTSLRNAL